MSKYIDIINEGTIHNLKTIYEQNYVDTVQVVRCKDCDMWSDSFEVKDLGKLCMNFRIVTTPDFYCAWGVRNE